MNQLRVDEFARVEDFDLGQNPDAKRSQIDRRLRKKNEYVAAWDGNTATIEPLFVGVMNPVAPDEIVEEGRRVLTAALYVGGNFFNEGIIGHLPEEITDEEFRAADDMQHLLWGWENFNEMGFQPSRHTADHGVFALYQV